MIVGPWCRQTGQTPQSDLVLVALVRCREEIVGLCKFGTLGPVESCSFISWRSEPEMKMAADQERQTRVVSCVVGRRHRLAVSGASSFRRGMWAGYSPPDAESTTPRTR